MSRIETYLANPRLKRAYVNVGFSNHQREEVRKCAADYQYFATNYYKILTLDHGEQLYQPYDFQDRMADTIIKNRFVICKMPRQSGKSVCVIGILLWYILFHKDIRIGILANKAASAKKLLRLVKYAYERLPKWLQQGVIGWGATSIELENGATIAALATASDAARGDSFNIVFLDEFAFVKANIAEEFFTAVFPTLSSGNKSKMIIVSTPQGMNYFYRLWTKAEKGRNEFVPLSIHWSEKPGRTPEWAEREKSVIGEDKFSQEYGCVGPLTRLSVRDRVTGETKEITAAELWGLL